MLALFFLFILVNSLAGMEGKERDKAPSPRKFGSVIRGLGSRIGKKITSPRKHDESPASASASASISSAGSAIHDLTPRPSLPGFASEITFPTRKKDSSSESNTDPKVSKKAAIQSVKKQLGIGLPNKQNREEESPDEWSSSSSEEYSTGSVSKRMGLSSTIRYLYETPEIPVEYQDPEEQLLAKENIVTIRKQKKKKGKRPDSSSNDFNGSRSNAIKAAAEQKKEKKRKGKKALIYTSLGDRDVVAQELKDAPVKSGDVILAGFNGSGSEEQAQTDLYGSLQKSIKDPGECLDRSKRSDSFQKERDFFEKELELLKGSRESGLYDCPVKESSGSSSSTAGGMPKLSISTEFITQLRPSIYKSLLIAVKAKNRQKTKEILDQLKGEKIVDPQVVKALAQLISERRAGVICKVNKTMLNGVQDLGILDQIELLIQQSAQQADPSAVDQANGLTKRWLEVINREPVSPPNAKPTAIANNDWQAFS